MYYGIITGELQEKFYEITGVGREMIKGYKAGVNLGGWISQ
jgi:hypothetical protein